MNNETVEALLDMGRLAERQIDIALAPFDLSVPQYRILELADGSITPTALAGHLCQETHSVSGLLNRLEDRDLVTRARDRQDRRVVHVGLTGLGAQTLDNSSKAILGAEQNIYAAVCGTASFSAGAFPALRDAMLKLDPRVTKRR